MMGSPRCLTPMLLLVAWVILPSAGSFAVVSRPAGLHSSSTSVFAKKKRRNDDEDDERRYQDALSLNKARTDVRNLLTQRAVQSFIFLLNSCRDPHTVRWLEVSHTVAQAVFIQKPSIANPLFSLLLTTQSNYQLKNIGSFHGTGAFNLTRFSEWDSVLTDMLEKPAEVVIITTRRRGRGRRQGSKKKNPYLKEVRVSFGERVSGEEGR